MLSVAIIARDEERHIGAALDSVAGLADEVVVLLDDRSADRTAAICRERGARVHSAPFHGFSAQRNRALELCRSDWVLFLDADERVTEELAAEIRMIADSILKIEDSTVNSAGGSEQSSIFNLQSSIAAGYWIPRHNLFFGRALRGGGWYPDRQLRLLRRGQARYDERRLVHEFAELDGPAGELRGHMLHNNIECLDELWRKQRAYALQEAQTLYRAGVRVRWRSFAGAPLRELYRRFVALKGYRDGALGLFLCVTLAGFELVKLAHLKSLERAR
jgi:glycosyltransferase involved in cell wall biosynthesis